jgi:cold shock CspA family protein
MKGGGDHRRGGGGGRDGDRYREGGFGGYRDNYRERGSYRDGDSFDDRRSGGGGGRDNYHDNYRDHAPRGGGSGGSRPPASTGRIAVLKDSFGFIDCAEGDGSKRHYFNFSSVLGRDKVPRMGDEVRYAVESARGREAAVRIEILPPGTLPPPPKPVEVRLQGVIESMSRERRGGSGGGNGG